MIDREINRDRAVIFGTDAERYDRARPSYPAELVDDLVSLGGNRVLDVGCGTGKAGRLLAERGLDVLGVEPDERMAEVARRHGLIVETCRFEEWDPTGRAFDLVVSGQAWHWVDQQVGPAKAADVLAPGGSFAAFWNRPRYDPEIRVRLDEVYLREAPKLPGDLATVGSGSDDRTPRFVEPIEATGRFTSVEVHVYPWEDTYSRDHYLDRLRTHSDHMLLAAEQRDRLLEAVGDVIAAVGGYLTVGYTTTLIHAVAARREQ